MLADSPAFSGYSVNDLKAAQAFYADKLGLDVADNGMGLELRTKGNNTMFLYEKADHQPATYTTLNFPVDDIDAAIDYLTARGVEMIHYNDDELPAEQDEKGVLRGRAAGMGPDIAWFKDPAGNVLAVLQN